MVRRGTQGRGKGDPPSKGGWQHPSGRCELELGQADPEAAQKVLGVVKEGKHQLRCSLAV